MSLELYNSIIEVLMQLWWEWIIPLQTQMLLEGN